MGKSSKKARKQTSKSSPQPLKATVATTEQKRDTPTARPGSRPSLIKRYGIETLIVAVGIVHALVVGAMTSPTFDEGKHIINGIAYMETRSCCLSDESPFSGLHAFFLDRERLALPAFDKSITPPAGTQFFNKPKNSVDRVLFRSRISSALFFGVLLLVVGLWLRALASARVSQIGMFIGAFCPSLLAYGSIASTDIHMAALGLLSLYQLLMFHRQPSLKKAAGIGFVLGLLLLTKFSALIFFGAYGLVLLILLIADVFRSQPKKRKRCLVAYLGYLGVVLALSLFVLNMGYLFKGTFSSLDQLDVESAQLTRMQASWIGKMPLPLPSGLIRAVDYSRKIADNESREIKKPAFLFGKSYPKGSRIYFAAALAVKSATVIIILFLFGGILYFKTQRPWEERLILLFCPLFVLIFMSIFDVFNKGIRYVFPVVPMMVVIAAYAFTWKRGRYLTVLLPFLVIGTLINFPNYIAYFNVSSLIFEKENMLVDSNLDWGQMDHLVVQDIKAHNVSKACPFLMQPNPAGRLKIPAAPATYPQPCTYYLSKSRKQFYTTPPMFKMMKSPDRVLGGVIDVFDITREADFKFKFLNRWLISEPFDNSGLNPERFLSLSDSLDYKEVAVTFGNVHINNILSENRLDGKCVIAKSQERAQGELMFTATGKMRIIDASGHVQAKTTPRRALKFYTTAYPLLKEEKITALICAHKGPLSFSIGYR